jgi:hypothetical protein
MIEQTIEVPASHRLTIDVPREIPTGTTACFKVIWFPVQKAVNNLDAVLEKIRNLCKDSSITVDSFLEMRRHDNELEENKYRNFINGYEANS